MDDIDLIRTALVQEGEQGRETARRHLRQTIAAERGALSAEVRRVAPPRPVPTRRWRWALAGTGLTATAAVLATVLAIAGGAAPPAPTSPPVAEATVAVPRTAQEFLLLAATEVAKAPATTGRYWYARWDTEARADGGTFVNGVPRWSVAEQWQASDPRDPSWYSYVQFKDGPYRPEVQKADSLGYGAEIEFSLAEVRAFPVDPVALRRVLARKAEAIGIDLAHLTADGMDGYVVEATTGLLARAPLTPAQRAAAYRLLATVPGVELVGTDTDSMGRDGLLLRYVGSKKTKELLVDRGSYQVLAVYIQGHSRRKFNTRTVFTIPGWTDEEPPH